NEKNIRDYYNAVLAGRLPIKKGYFLTAEDLSFRRYILDMSCKGQTVFQERDLPVLEQYVFPRLTELAKDGLVEWDTSGCELTPQGYYFLRNVCSAFDVKLHRGEQLNTQVFSKAI
ncbi:MAG: oxygen-independent coproporphyrinogen III oxidase, partial [Flavisolibacter sp.]